MFLSGPLRAKVTIDSIDPARGVFRVTYDEIPNSFPGAEDITMPAKESGGYSWGEFEKIRVDEIIEINSKKKFKGSIDSYQSAGRPWRQLRIMFDRPDTADTPYKFMVKLVMTSKKHCYFDGDGQLVIKYFTAHETCVVFPEGYEPSFNNASADTEIIDGKKAVHTRSNDNYSSANPSRFTLRELVFKARRPAGK